MRFLVILLWAAIAVATEEQPIYAELVSGPDGRLEYAPDPSGSGSFFRYVDTTGQEIVLKSDEIDPFFNAPTLTATMLGKRAIVAGLTGASPLIASISLAKPARIDKVLPVIMPTVKKDLGRVAFLSWQDRGNTNTHTTVVNIWQIAPSGVIGKVVYPPANALENNPQPWVGGTNAISMVSPLAWSDDGSHLGFVIRSGTDYIYHFVDIKWGDGSEPVIRRTPLPLVRMFLRDPKLYIGGVGLRVRSIEWKGGEALLSFEPRPYMKEVSTAIPEGKAADYRSNKALLQEQSQGASDRLLRFAKTRIDLGLVEKKMQRIEFTYTNPTAHDVAILAVAKSCTCLTFEEHDSVVPPKGAGSLGVWVDMTETSGPLLQSIIVLIASEEDVQSLRLTVKGSSK